MDSDSSIKSSDEVVPSLLIKVLYEVDRAIGRVFANVLQFIIALLFLIFIVLSLLALVVSIFEYWEGLSDISPFELLFLISCVVLVERYVGYTRKASLDKWDRVSAPFIWFGKLMLVQFIVFLAVLVGVVAVEDAMPMERVSTEVFRLLNYGELFVLGSFLVSLYVAVPSRKPRVKTHNDDVDEKQVHSESHTSPPPPHSSQS